MYHHKHHAARVAVINYPAGQDRLIRSWFGGRTRLVNNDKWRHAPSYIILRFCLKLGKPFIFLKFSNIYIFPSGGRVCWAHSFATRACFIFTQLHTPRPQVPLSTTTARATVSSIPLKGTLMGDLQRLFSHSFHTSGLSENVYQFII